MTYVNQVHVFTYAARKGSYLSILGTLFFLSIAEAPLIVLLIIHFLPGLLLQTLAHLTFGLLTLALFGMLLSPLWTSHRVSATTLELRYGLNFHARIPLSTLVSARAVREKVGPLPGVHYEPAHRRLVLAFSNDGQVLLHMAHPQKFRLGLRRVYMTDLLLISVDQREDFLAALNLHSTRQDY